MKLTDVMITGDKNGVYLCVKNGRGNPKAGGIDITDALLSRFLEVLRAGEGKSMVYQPAGCKDEMYYIDVKSLTPDEITEHNRKENTKRAQFERIFASFTSVYNSALRRFSR